MKKLYLYQGPFNEVQLQDDAERLAAYDTVVLSHVKTIVQSNGCIDQGYEDIGALIHSVHATNPDILIYGYVPATADAPDGTACGYNPASPDWEPKNGTCMNFIEWSEAWAALNVDGIFIDLVAQQYISPIVRDDVFSYVKDELELKIMANSTSPDPANIRFVCGSLYFGKDDTVLIEGGVVQAGKNTLPATNAAVYVFNTYYRKYGYNLAALVTEPAGALIVPGSTNDLNARSFFEHFSPPGGLYQYTEASYGIASRKIP